MFLLLSTLACTGDPAAPPSKPPSRVETAPVAAKRAADPEAFCDSRGGQAFAWPELDAAPPADPGGWKWVNVWATWCKPCLAEMAQIQDWAKKLNASGTAVTQQFMSVDNKAEDLSTFQKLHPGPASSRLHDVTLLTPWLESQGLDAGASLPLHLFVDSTNTIRCVRMGSVGENDYDAIAAVLAGK